MNLLHIIKKCREKPALWKFGFAKLRSARDGLSYKIKKGLFLLLMVSTTLWLCAFSTFRGEQGQDAANVVSSVTPVDTTRGGTIWTHNFSTGNRTSYNSIPILTEKAIYLVNQGTLYELSYEDGSILRQLSLSAKMNSVCHMLLQDHDLFIPLNNGKMECVDTTTMTSRWQSESFGGQSLSTLFYHEGFLYAGTTLVNYPDTTGTFYCLDASDGSTQWTYEDTEHKGGYYWSGAIVHDDALFFSGDNGILVSHSLLTDEVYDTYPLTNTAKIRAGITYNKAANAMYTSDTDGILYKIQTSGKQIESVQSCSIVPEAGQKNCTSTPTIYNNRIYIGCLADRYGYVVVLDAIHMQPVYKVQGPLMAEVKSSPLVSTRGDNTGKVWVYFSANAQPGGIYYFTDQPDSLSASWETLYTPAAAKQFCLSSITSGEDGTLYYSNDSGTLFAVREVDQSSDRIATPLPTLRPAQAPAPTVLPQVTAPKPKETIQKPPKPAKVKIKRKKKKIIIRWSKKQKSSQTILSYRYGSGKWKKKTVKKKTTYSLPVKRKKKIQIRLRCKKKIKGKWYYSGYTKTFHLKC